MTRRGIVCAGNWLIDTVKTLDRFPPEGELAQVLRTDRAAGGACNLLFDLAKLQAGLPLWGCGCVGDDHGGRWLLSELDRLNINSDCMRTVPGGETAGTDVMSVGGKRTFFYNAGCNRLFTTEDLAGIDVPAKIVYLAYILLLPALDAPDAEYGTCAARALAGLQQKGYLTAVDLVSAAPERFMEIVPPALPHMDIFVINEVEAGNLCNMKLRKDDGSLDEPLLEKAARKLLELGVHKLAAIHYPEGCVAATAEGEFSVMPSCPMEKKDIVGTNGAGDAFFAGLLYAYHEGKTLPEMLRYASASARFNLRHATANGGAPTLTELEDFLKSKAEC